MSKRPMPSSPQPNPRPPKSRLAGRIEVELPVGNSRARTQENAHALKDKTNTPKTNTPKTNTPKTTSKFTKTRNEPEEETNASAATKSKVTAKPTTNSKPGASAKSTTSNTKSNVKNKTKGGAKDDVIELSTAESDDGDSEYEDISDDDKEEPGLADDSEDDEPGDDEPVPAEDDLVVNSKAKANGRKPRSNHQNTKVASNKSSNLSDAAEPVSPPKGKGKGKGKGKAKESKPKAAKAPRAKASTNRATRKSVALTTPAARDVFNGMDKFLNKWAKCSELHILRTREERLTHEAHLKVLEKQQAHQTVMENYEKKWLKLNPERVANMHKIHEQDSRRKLLEVEEKVKATNLQHVEREIEFMRLREENEGLRNEKKKAEEAVEEGQAERDMEDLQDLYDDI